MYLKLNWDTITHQMEINPKGRGHDSEKAAYLKKKKKSGAEVVINLVLFYKAPNESFPFYIISCNLKTM